MKPIPRHSLTSTGIALLLLAGCAVGPNYNRPVVNTPAAYRPAASDTNAFSSTNSFADLGWWDAYDDPQLKVFLAEALTNSWDIKIAAARVLQAEASARITRSRFSRAPMPAVTS